MPEQDGKGLCPTAVTLQCADASDLHFDDGEFNLVMQFTVFTSILDNGVKKKIAAEMRKVLKPGGGVLWYDYFVSNPRNPGCSWRNQPGDRRLVSPVYHIYQTGFVGASDRVGH